MYILFLHSFINENLENFHLLAIVNDAAINTGVQMTCSNPSFQVFWITESNFKKTFFRRKLGTSRKA